MAEAENQNKTGSGEQNQPPDRETPPDESQKEAKNTTRAQGRKTRGKGSEKQQEGAERPTPMGSKDKLTDIRAAQGPLQPTVIDAQGVERIVGPAVDERWNPAPTEASEEEVAHRQRVAENDAARREERLGATQVSRSTHPEGVDSSRKAFEAERKGQGGKS